MVKATCILCIKLHIGIDNGLPICDCCTGKNSLAFAHLKALKCFACEWMRCFVRAAVFFVEAFSIPDDT